MKCIKFIDGIAAALRGMEEGNNLDCGQNYRMDYVYITLTGW